MFDQMTFRYEFFVFIVYSVVEYPYLTSFDMMCMKIAYSENFVLNKRTYVSHRIKIEVNYKQLKMATVTFTRNEILLNCTKVLEMISAYVNYNLVYFRFVFVCKTIR